MQERDETVITEQGVSSEHIQAEPTQESQIKKEIYIPSSIEKKRAVMMYIGLGILMMLPKEKISLFEHFHLKQSLGRRSVMLILCICMAVLLFVPIIKRLIFLPVGVMVGVWVWLIHQAIQGYWSDDKANVSIVALFSGLGGWILNIFEVNIQVERNTQ